VLNSTVRRKAWWSVLGLCLGLLSAPAFSFNSAATFSGLFAFDLHVTTAGVVENPNSPGIFYGTTADTSLTGGGTIFKVSKAGGAPDIVYQLKETDGYSPQATLLVGRNGSSSSATADGYLYGSTVFAPRVGGQTSYGSGTIFRIALDGSGYTTLFTFDVSSANLASTGLPTNTYGMHPAKALIQDATYLYGVTPAGGANGTGTVFKIRKADGHAEVLYSFKDTDTTGVTSTGEGAYPSSPLTLGSDGRLYGVTIGGGANLHTTTDSAGNVSKEGTGTIYSLNVDGTGLQTYSFDALDTVVSATAGASTNTNATGIKPMGALLELSPGVFIGTASNGGNPAANPSPPTPAIFGYGTVFRFDATNSQVTTLYNFDLTTGSAPLGNLILNNGIGGDGLVYGVTSAGTTPSFGSFYSIDPTSGAFQLLHAPTSGEGYSFIDSLTLGSDGDLYGAVRYGSACTVLNGQGYGAVYRYSITTGQAVAGYANCTQPSNSGGGSMSWGFLWLLAALGLAPTVRRRLM